MTKNCWELSAMISENFEITWLKWLKNMTHTHQLSQVLQMKIFFSSFIFAFVNLALTSKEVKCYQNTCNSVRSFSFVNYTRTIWKNIKFR